MRTLKNLTLRHLFFITSVLLFVLFWLRCVDFVVNFYTTAKLLTALSIVLPLLLIMSQDLRLQIRKIFQGKYKFLKLLLYVLVVTFFYSIFIFKDNTTPIFYPKVYAFLGIWLMHISYPVVTIFLGYIIFEKYNDSNILLRIFFFIIYAQLLRFVPISTIMSILSLPNANFLSLFFLNGSWTVLNLYEFWQEFLPILIIMVSNIPENTFGLGKKIDNKMLIYIFFGTLSVIFLSLGISIFKNIIMWNRPLILNVFPSIQAIMIIPIVEEFIYRGVIQNCLTLKLKPIKDGAVFSVIISSTLFGLSHYPFEATNFPYTFVLGLLCGWVYHKSQNLWIPIFVHGFNNLLWIAVL